MKWFVKEGPLGTRASQPLAHSLLCKSHANVKSVVNNSRNQSCSAGCAHNAATCLHFDVYVKKVLFACSKIHLNINVRQRPFFPLRDEDNGSSVMKSGGPWF